MITQYTTADSAAPGLNLKVIDQISRHIVPFAYELNFESALEKLDQSFAWERKDLKKERLFHHISRLIDEADNHETIGKRYLLTQKGRSTVKLPNNHDECVVFMNDKDEPIWTFSIASVELYVFETQVAFLVMNIVYPLSYSVRQIVDANYDVKKLYFGGQLKWTKKTSINEETVHQTPLSKLVIEWVQPLMPSTYFDNQRLVPEYALVYNAILLDKQSLKHDNDAALREILFWMRRSFRESYRPDPSELEPNNPDVLREFENSYWGISLEGLANLSYLIDNDKLSTNSFFTGNYFSHLRNAYFYIFMLALHQKYALLHLSIAASLLPRRLDEYVRYDAGQVELDRSIESLRERMIFFSLRCSFKHVSNITHQAKIYSSIRDVLGIDDLTQSLHFEIDLIGKMSGLREKQAREQKAEAEVVRKESERILKEAGYKIKAELKEIEDERKKKNDEWITVVSMLFLIISTISGSWKLFSDIFKPHELTVFLVSSALIIGVAGYLARIRMSNIRKMKQKIKRLEEQQSKINHSV